MKEMFYTRENRRELLYNDIYKGFHYYIMSYGTHPCGYIEINKDFILYHKDYDDIILDVHGGLTYSRDYLKTSEGTTLENSWFIGWDYAHCDDYCGYEEYMIESIRTYGKKWTTEEIIEDCKKAIDLLINNEQLFKIYFYTKELLEIEKKLLWEM